MNKTALNEISPLIEKLTCQAQALIDSESTVSSRLAKEQEVLVPFANKISVLTRAYRTAISGKSHEDIAALSVALVDKIEQTINLYFQEIKIKDLISSSKKSGYEEMKQKIIDSYNEALGDLDRIAEVSTMIESGNEPTLGRKRKPGTRPEKLSVVRHAQDNVKAKPETPQEGE